MTYCRMVVKNKHLVLEKKNSYDKNVWPSPTMKSEINCQNEVLVEIGCLSSVH